LLRFSGTLSLVAAAAACGADPGDTDSGGDVTLATLAADQRAAFEAWKAQPVKDCLWTQAFPALAKEALDDRGVPAPQPTPHVDVTALYADTQGSPLIQSPGGAIVLLGLPLEDPSASRAELHTTYTRDGQTTRSLSVSSVRDGGECVVTLGDQEVFRTRMAAAMPITAFADPGDPGPGGKELTPPVFDPAHVVGAIDAAPLLARTLDSLTPDVTAIGILGAHFKTADVADDFRVFKLGTPQLPVTVRPQLAGTPEFAPDAVMYGPIAAIAPLGNTATIGVDLLFTPLVADASAEPGTLLVVHAEIAVEAQGRLAHPTSFTVKPAIVRSSAAAFACFASRVQLASAFITATAPRLPGFDAMFSSCRELAVDGDAALLADPASQQVIARATFTGPVTRTTAYLGWDTRFLNIVDRLLSAGTDLAVLDPDHANPALDTALARAKAWLAAVPSAAPAELRTTVVPTSLRWALDGVSALTELDGLIPPTFSHAGAVYPGSVLRMLNDVTSGVPVGLAAARCGATLVGDHAARVAATIAHAAALPEARRFTDALRGQVLQVCPDDTTLARIDAAVDAARMFVAEDKTRGDALFESAAELLVEHTIRETWTSASYAALGDLLALGSVRHPCSFASYAMQVVVCLNNRLDRFSTAHGALLDPALAARHAEFVRDFLPIHQGWLSGAAFADVRRAIDTIFFDRGLWTGCTDQGFAAARANLFQALDQLHTAAPMDQPDIEDAIITQVTATTCP
jgi:hypothetical protein